MHSLIEFEHLTNSSDRAVQQAAGPAHEVLEGAIVFREYASMIHLHRIGPPHIEEGRIDLLLLFAPPDRRFRGGRAAGTSHYKALD